MSQKRKSDAAALMTRMAEMAVPGLEADAEAMVFMGIYRLAMAQTISVVSRQEGKLR